jgi:hypothetical protein
MSKLEIAELERQLGEINEAINELKKSTGQLEFEQAVKDHVHITERKDNGYFKIILNNDVKIVTNVYRFFPYKRMAKAINLLSVMSKDL